MNKQLISDIIQWDVNSWSKALIFWENKIEWERVESALELGGREGGLTLWLTLKGINTVCSDLKDVKSTAEKLHLKHKVSSFITYQDINATDIPFENHFDLIVFKSIIGGIGRNDDFNSQHKVFKQIYKALKPGGKLLFAENLISSPIHQKLRKRYVNWGSSWRYVTLNDMKIFLQEFSKSELKTTGVLGSLGRNENQRYFLSKIDDFILNKLCPNSWKYICYGIAEK